MDVKQKIQNSTAQDILILYSLVIISIIAAYFAPPFVKSVLFIFIIFLFMIENVDYIFLSFLFFIADMPGLLFFGKTSDIIKVSLLSISFAELFAIASLVKVILIKRKNPGTPFKEPFRLYFVFLLYLILAGLVSGMRVTGTISTGLGPYKRTITMMLMYTLYFTIPIILNSYEKIYKLLNLLFTIVILNFSLQLFHIIYGISFHDFLGGKSFKELESVRPVYGAFSSCLSLFFSYYLITQNKGNKRYLNFIFVISFLVMFISATRGWIIGYLFFILMSNLSYIRKNFTLIVRRSVPIILILMAVYQIGIVKHQIQYSITRLTSVELILEGDITAGGTNTRLTDRSIPVMNKFFERPILGWGFSSTGFETYDGHVGNQSILMNGGVVGAFVVFIVLLLIIRIILKYNRRLIRIGSGIKKFNLFAIAIGTLFIIHSSSTDLFGFLAPTLDYQVYKIVFLGLFFGIIGNIIKLSEESYRYNLRTER